MNITNKSGIYKIENLVNGKMYIGQTNNLKRRKSEHFSLKRTHHCRLVLAAMKKYGKENMRMSVIEYCEISKLDEREQYWIETIKPEYNIAIPNGRNYEMTEEIRTKISQNTKKWWDNLPTEKQEKIISQNLSGPAIGKKCSPETREKLKKANLGKKQSKETIEKRKLTTKKRYETQPKDGSGHWKRVFVVEIGKEFESVKDCAKFIGVNPSSVSATAKGRYKTCKGYHIKYVV